MDDAGPDCETADRRTGDTFMIVGIGASAGGVEALEGFFRGVMDEPDMAFVIVTHLDPERDSVLHEIVARYTGMQVVVATDGIRIERNTVHVTPSGVIPGITDGCLSLRRPDQGRRERKPIDLFFAALATDQGPCAAGVVLSGGDGDGALGIKAIKEHGGVTLAQLPDSHGPQHPSMPQSAISTGMVDFALPVGEMGNRLVQFAHKMSQAGDVADEQAFDDARQQICGLLRAQTGHDFAGYKVRSFARRVQRRMQIVQCASVAAYMDLLREAPQEVTALFRDLLINVTNFFRDPAAFQALTELVIPKLFDGRGNDNSVRVWIPACATGEEVYSVAMLLCEHMATLTVRPRVQIFATDIDEHALAVGRAGRYPAALLAGVSAERLERHFDADDGGFLVKKAVRDLCVFSPHSVIRDPPFSRIDLISCRNLLIYFGIDVQNEVMPTFHYSLRAEGFLFLGTAENIGQFGDLFLPLDKKQRIFRSRSDSVTRPLQTPPGILRELGRRSDTIARPGINSGMALRAAVEAQVLDRFAPAHVVVNIAGDVVYYSGRTGKYIEATAGQPTRQILTLARRGLRLELHTLFRQAVESRRPVRREHLVVEGDDGRVQPVTLTIEPLQERSGEDRLFVILFTDEGPALMRQETPAQSDPGHDTAALHFERELRDTRERLQSLVEEYETAIEELKSSNEELVSVNEEVQSSNEELEASKEELQSLNEELHTVNAELGSKIDLLDQANGDLQNLFESSGLATIFLDSRLVIRTFTPAVGAIFNIRPGDRGRPITDLASRLALPDFAGELATVLSTGSPIERRLDKQDGRHFLMRLSAYRDPADQVDGMVVTFVDITSLAAAEVRQNMLIAELQHRTRNLLAMVQAIAMQTLGRGGSMESYMQRLSALGRVQALLGQGNGDVVSLGDIVRLELHAHVADDARVHVEGPSVALRRERVQTFALALHELSTNALKHGALQVADGRLDVSWSLQDRDALDPDVERKLAASSEPAGRYVVLDWSETGVAIMAGQSNRQGYGRKLIEHALSFALGAHTRLEFRATGLHCRIVVPLATVEP